VFFAGSNLGGSLCRLIPMVVFVVVRQSLSDLFR
jgi:hypothetical protein